MQKASFFLALGFIGLFVALGLWQYGTRPESHVGDVSAVRGVSQAGTYEVASAFERELIDASNAVRQRYNTPALEVDSTLMAVARQRAADMAWQGYFSHTAPNGETAFSLLAGRGYQFDLAGENIARNNYPNDDSVGVSMRAFEASSGHLQNMVDPAFRHIGVGAAIGAGGMKYFVIVFAS